MIPKGRASANDLGSLYFVLYFLPRSWSAPPHLVPNPQRGALSPFHEGSEKMDESRQLLAYDQWDQPISMLDIRVFGCFLPTKSQPNSDSGLGK